MSEDLIHDVTAEELVELVRAGRCSRRWTNGDVREISDAFVDEVYPQYVEIRFVDKRVGNAGRLWLDLGRHVGVVIHD